MAGLPPGRRNSFADMGWYPWWKMCLSYAGSHAGPRGTPRTVPRWGFPKAEAWYLGRHRKQSPSVTGALRMAWWAWTTAETQQPRWGCSAPWVALTISGFWRASPMHSTLKATSRTYWIPLQHLLMLESPLPTGRAARRSLSVSWGRNGGVRVEGCKNGKHWSSEAEPGEKGPWMGPTPSVFHMRSFGGTVTTSGFGICTAETLSQPNEMQNLYLSSGKCSILPHGNFYQYSVSVASFKVFNLVFIS